MDSSLQLLRKLISINSVFPHEVQLAKFAAAYLRSCGFSVRLQQFSPGRFNVIAQKGPRRGAVLLSAHLDTVPPYNYGKRNPFRMQLQGDRILGLGAWDMKAGLALVLGCARQCRPGSRGLRIVLTADEENISEGTWFAQKRGEFSGCSIALCHEIPDIPQWAQPGGRPPIITGRRGRCVYRFRVSGIGAHGAGSGGISAFSLGVLLASALERIPMPKGKTGQCRLFIRSFKSESTSLAMPTSATLEADVHYVPPYTPQRFLAYIRSSLRGLKFPAGCGWSAQIPPRKTPYLPAYQSRTDSPLARAFFSSYNNRIGKYKTAYGMTVADENVLSVEGFPVITLGPAGGLAHSCGEWVSKKDFLLLCEKVPQIVQDLLDS